jgi:hypothetical protein
MQIIKKSDNSNEVFTSSRLPADEAAGRRVDQSALPRALRERDDREQSLRAISAME